MTEAPPTDTDIVVAVPMLGRPHHIEPLLSSLDATAPGARVVFGLTPTDRSVVDVVRRLRREHVLVDWKPRGDYARKVNTIYRQSLEPYIFCAASDLRFHEGWWQAALDALAPGVGVVGTNDLGSPRVIAGDHSTHSLVARWYADEFGLIDQPGAVLCEAYVHEFCDDELVETAKARGAWAFAEAAKVEHLHPNWGKGDRGDRLYAQQRNRMRVGRPIYMMRRRQWAT